MKKTIALIISLMLLTLGNAMACPGCMGTNPNDKYYLWVIGAFVLVIYFPMFYLFKTMFKWRSVNDNTDSTRQ